MERSTYPARAAHGTVDAARGSPYMGKRAVRQDLGLFLFGQGAADRPPPERESPQFPEDLDTAWYTKQP
jgi:hypothetical protein